uniref:Amine oxidase domain-containing protein n=1 Tax=Xiphophorus couchianus TaxID=32473 RepID=A0A3B5LWZ0_9TELE
MAENVDAKIVIIGCGIAGIAAAHRLVKSGFTNVRILEATGRSGGRIKTGRLEIGAAFIHGPSEENPVFCLARDYNLLDPKSLTPENQAVDVGEDPPLVPNWFTSSGERISKHVAFSIKIKINVVVFVKKTQQIYVLFRSEVLVGAMNSMLKEECCASATHSLEDLDLIGFSMYLSIKGVDCTFPRFAHTLDQKQLSPDLDQTPKVLELINTFSKASGLTFNLQKCELMEIHGSDLMEAYSIPLNPQLNIWEF